MLVLSRKKDEQVIITVGNDRVVLTVVESTPGRVKLGFDAPEHVAINRREVQDVIDADEATRD